MLRKVLSAILIWIGLTDAVFCIADDIGSVTITVELEMPGEKPKPLENAVVYIPPTKYVYNPELMKWLKENAKPPKQSVHKFAIKDKQVVPQFDFVYVGDSVDRQIDEHETLSIGIMDNTPSSSLDHVYLFLEPEKLPILLEAMIATDSRPATILVSDHTIHAITDKNGVVKFPSLPRFEQIPFRIRAVSSDAKSRFQYSSSSLKMSPGGRFEVDNRTTAHEHTIRVAPQVLQK